MTATFRGCHQFGASAVAPSSTGTERSGLNVAQQCGDRPAMTTDWKGYLGDDVNDRTEVVGQYIEADAVPGTRGRLPFVTVHGFVSHRGGVTTIDAPGAALTQPLGVNPDPAGSVRQSRISAYTVLSRHFPARNTDCRMTPSRSNPAFSSARCSAMFSSSVYASTRCAGMVSSRY
jgi:hypothetical protein